MVHKIPESEEQELYHDYTIHALHAPRENKKAIHLYQLLLGLKQIWILGFK